ncbi:MAG: hypothetical protein JWM19_915 [Actinomycetia bacterium]|nr:hypothetical protein [Actinomycetes bacterium]
MSGVSHMVVGVDGVVAIIDSKWRRYKVAECARCGLEKRIKGRGLCPACSSAVTRDGTIGEYGWMRDERLEEFAGHRRHMNITRAGAATGISTVTAFRYERLLREREAGDSAAGADVPGADGDDAQDDG